MNRPNKLVVWLMVFACVTSFLSGCGKENHHKDDKIRIVCTVYPQYDWVKALTEGSEEAFEVTLLLDDGTDMHSYQPTAEDMIKIADCDVFIYVGGESDGWVEDAIQESVNKGMRQVNLLETLGENARSEELVDGMQEEGHGQEEEVQMDEHVWLSLKNARIFIREIYDTLHELNYGEEEVLNRNYERYFTELQKLDKEYQNAVDSAAEKTILFADRFPFLYLAEDYGLEYYAAFSGCSAETEASFKTIAFLAEKVDELKLPAVLVLENSDGRIAKSVIQNTKTGKQQVLAMDSLQSVKRGDIRKGMSYLSVMEKNLSILKQALGE